MDGDWLKMGIVGRPRGLKGQFYLSGRHEPMPRTQVRIGYCFESSITAEVTESCCHNGRPLIACSAATERNEASKLVGQTVWVRRNAVDDLADDEFFWSDLEGLDVIDSLGKVCGKVVHISNFNASDIMTIKGSKGSLDIPLVPTYFDLGKIENPLRLLVPCDVFEEFWY